MEPTLAAKRGDPRAYPNDPGAAYDEAFEADGRPRAHYRELLDRLAERDLGELASYAKLAAEELAMEFGDGDPFVVDPVPRILEPREWHKLERGLAQRATALTAFLADLHGERRILAAGRIPERIVESAELAEPDMRELPAGADSAVAGFDVIRCPSGELRVLEDNLRTPSGITYATGAREIVDRLLECPAPRVRLEPERLFGEALRAAAPAGVDEPVVVLLSDGPENSAWWEHRRIADALGIPLVTPADLEGRAGRVRALTDGRTLEVDVIYRRTNEERLRGEDGALTWLGELVIEPMRRGTLACVNGFGTGVADDKLVHAYVEEMIRFYLGEAPLIASVRTYDLAEPELRERVLERIDELVVKPRTGTGGSGVIVCPHASAEDRALAAELVRTRPEDHVAQEVIPISTHPTVVDGAIEPRHVDLRAFAFSGPDGASVMAGGLTRVALERGALVVNSSMKGGGKDTWVLA